MGFIVGCRGLSSFSGVYDWIRWWTYCSCFLGGRFNGWVCFNFWGGFDLLEVCLVLVSFLLVYSLIM